MSSGAQKHDIFGYTAEEWQERDADGTTREERFWARSAALDAYWQAQDAEAAKAREEMRRSIFGEPEVPEALAA